MEYMSHITRDDARDFLPQRIANAEQRIENKTDSYEYAALSLQLVLLLDSHIVALGPSSYDLESEADRDLLDKAKQVRYQLNNAAQAVLRALRKETS